jgi:hypothetical protein
VLSKSQRFLFRSGERAKLIVMLDVFIDESGTHQGSKVFILAGYLGTADEWASVEARFRRADKHAGVPFHAVDCANGGKDYLKIKMHKEKRNRITKKMVKIVNDHDIFGVGCGVWLDDYESVYPRNGQHWETWLLHPFRICFQLLMGEMCRYAETKYPNEKLAVVLEDSPHWYPSAAKVFLATKKESRWPYHHMLGTIAPFSPKEAPQLYAPDLLAYETYLLKSRERYPTGHRPRQSMLALLKKRLDGKMWDSMGLKVAKRIDETGKFDPADFPEYHGLEVWKRTLPSLEQINRIAKK